MPKRIIILDPNGVEVATGSELSENWSYAVAAAVSDLAEILKRDNPKLGTYTVTVKEVE